MSRTTIKELDCKCNICGVAITQKEISAEINGQFIDYNERLTGEASIVFCQGCWEKFCYVDGIDQGDAILKRKELEKDEPRPPQIEPAQTPEDWLEENPFGVDLPDGSGVGI